MKRWDEVRVTTAYIEVKTLKDEDKAKEQLIKELRQRNAELKKSEIQRKEAEKMLQEKTESLQELSDKDVQHQVHELRTHQIELEMQNEELRKAQIELEEARNKYADLYDFAPIGYFTFDKNGLIMDVNLTGANKLGIERSFLIKTPFSLYIVEDSKDTFYLHLRKVFSSKIRQTCEIKLVGKDGIQFDAQLESLLVQSSEGKSNQCRTAISDITERKLAEALNEALNNIYLTINSTLDFGETMQRVVMEAAKAIRCETAAISLRKDNLWIVSYNYGFPQELVGTQMSENEEPHAMLAIKAGKPVAINDAYNDERVNREHMKKYGVRSVLVSPLLAGDKPIGVIFLNRHSSTVAFTEAQIDFARKFGASLSLAIENARLFEERKRIEDELRKSHEELEIRVQERTAELVEANKAIQEWISKLEETNVELKAEIAERRHAEEQIRDQASLLDKAQDAIGVRDLEHGLIYWNKGAQHLYDWMAEEVIGKNADELLYKEESHNLIEAKKSVIEKGEWIGELHQVTKDGKEIIVESRWSLIRDNEGKPKSILIINTDITEKRKLESQLLRAQRMESIGTLASGIAHDINNVLTPIMLSQELLREKLTDEESQRLLNAIEKSTQRGATLMKQVQSFAKGIEGERNVLQIAQIVSEIREIAKETFPRSIKIRIDIPKDLWTISGDSTQLNQVLMNLCVNARDAMSDGGILSISAENLFIDETYARMNIEAKIGPYIVISVSDTGTGIPLEVMDRIFEPFFTTKEHGKGTGLGLSTSLGIVKSHGGFITVYSEVGKGTVFKIYLPAITTPETQKAEEKQLELPAGHGESILVVDDEDQIREITKKTLETHGYRVITANDGKEAVSLYSKYREKIKLVLMDMMMPVMEGSISIRELHKINPELKIIAVSGLTETDKLAKVDEAHEYAFLTKPYTTEKLLNTIYDVINTN